MKAIFNSEFPDLSRYNGELVSILKESSDEIFGLIYKVRFSDGLEEFVFLSEVRVINER